mmetsp:Transcript_26073/g.60397  ORF Transcript_26073/g.60397 Transcript_26073/m.60397 type:complete len:87 (-) Transcript_26073:35-295(-)
MKDGFSEAALSAAKALAEGEFQSDRKAAMYIKIMQKIQEKGEAYPAQELQRVTKIAEGKIAPDKKAELEDKMKVLGIFGESKKDEL